MRREYSLNTQETACSPFSIYAGLRIHSNSIPVSRSKTAQKGHPIGCPFLYCTSTRKLCLTGRWELEACFAIPLYPICRHSFCHAITDRVFSRTRIWARKLGDKWRQVGNRSFLLCVRRYQVDKCLQKHYINKRRLLYGKGKSVSESIMTDS